MTRFFSIICAVAVAVLTFAGAPAQGADGSSGGRGRIPRTNIRYAMPAVWPGNASFDSDDIAVLGQKGHRLWKGVPFFLHANNGILKLEGDYDSITTCVKNAVGVFLLGATEGIGDRDVSSIGMVTYVFDDGSECYGEIMFHDHYQFKEQLEPDGNSGYPFESADGSIYTVRNNEFDEPNLATYNLDVIYHSIPQGNIINIIFDDWPDDDGDPFDSPIWIYGITVATTP